METVRQMSSVSYNEEVNQCNWRNTPEQLYPQLEEKLEVNWKQEVLQLPQ